MHPDTGVADTPAGTLSETSEMNSLTLSGSAVTYLVSWYRLKSLRPFWVSAAKRNFKRGSSDEAHIIVTCSPSSSHVTPNQLLAHGSPFPHCLQTPVVLKHHGKSWTGKCHWTGTVPVAPLSMKSTPLPHRSDGVVRGQSGAVHLQQEIVNPALHMFSSAATSGTLAFLLSSAAVSVPDRQYGPKAAMVAKTSVQPDAGSAVTLPGRVK